MTRGWVVVVAAITTIAGFAAGFALAIDMNPLTADRYTLNLGSAGEWVSGLGALSAVLATLYLAKRDRDSQKENLRVQVSQGVETPYQGRRLLAIYITNAGTRPVTVDALVFRSKKFGVLTGIIAFYEGSLPQTLTYGESCYLALHPGMDQSLIELVENQCDGCFKELQFVVMSTLEQFPVSVTEQQLRLIHRRPQS